MGGLRGTERRATKTALDEAYRVIRFLHTADLQLGMPFHRLPPETATRLRDARLDAVDRVVQAASDAQASFILVAGDFFDANTIDDRTIIQACDRFGRAEIPVIAIPGNHDHGGPGTVWQRAVFTHNRPDNLHILLDRTPWQIPELPVLILPAPLLRRREPGDPTTHWTADPSPDMVRIGLAHGGVIDFTAEGVTAANLIDPQRAQKAGLDYLALGDYHGCRKVDDRTWYAGTPEPTTFKENDPGYVLVVTAEKGGVPEVERVAVAKTAWMRHSVHIEGPTDLDRLRTWFESLPNTDAVRLRLELEGSLSLADFDALNDALTRMGGLLLHLDARTSGVTPMASEAELDGIAQDGYVHATIASLRTVTDGDGPEAHRARRALQLLHHYHALQEAP